MPAECLVGMIQRILVFVFSVSEVLRPQNQIANEIMIKKKAEKYRLCFMTF
jgi:hypothetical protein